jgi:dATP pyrophosphohydrolase
MYRIPRQVLVYLYRRREDGAREYLLLKRRGPREEWIFWQGVSGAPEGNESDAEAAVREVREETGIDVGDALEPVDYRYELRWRDQDPEFWDRLYAPGVEAISEEVYSAEVPADWEPILSAEHKTHRWCKLDDALGLLKYEDNKKALTALHEQLGR